MGIDVFYFSGTGNSLSVARALSQTLGGRLRSIASVVRGRETKVCAETVGVVFPAYLAQRHGVPAMVERFVQELPGIRSKKIFAVCTCGGFELVNAVPTLHNLRKVIQSVGGAVFAEFSIKLPMNNLTYPTRFIDQDQPTMFARSKAVIAEIGERVKNHQSHRNRLRNTVIHGLLTPVYALLGPFYSRHVQKMAQEPRSSPLTYFEMVQRTDRSIAVKESCNGCGVCSKVCPAGNIEIQAGKPVFLHHCEMCLACDEWCPSRSLRHWCKTEGKDYHHPEVKTSDMLEQTGTRPRGPKETT